VWALPPDQPLGLPATKEPQGLAHPEESQILRTLMHSWHDALAVS